MLPWLHEASRRKLPIAITDCGKCMNTRPTQIRQRMGCGFELPIPEARPWSPSSMSADWKFSELEHDIKVCPGYLCNLPQAIEAAQARAHWKEGGGLHDFCDVPHEHIRQAVLILEGASNECNAWAMQNPEKK